MKKLALGLVAIALFSIVSCKKDNDGGSSSDCCSYALAGVNTKVCKKDANTVTITSGGVSTDVNVQSTAGMSADAYIAALKTSSGCN